MWMAVYREPAARLENHPRRVIIAGWVGRVCHRRRFLFRTLSLRQSFTFADFLAASGHRFTFTKTSAHVPKNTTCRRVDYDRLLLNIIDYTCVSLEITKTATTKRDYNWVSLDISNIHYWLWLTIIEYYWVLLSMIDYLQFSMLIFIKYFWLLPTHILKHNEYY